jgi:acyl-CoA reductase-like NAD-dependent aldehyde dehydrogenase
VSDDLVAGPSGQERAVDPDASYKLRIGDAWVEGGDGSYDVINPATEALVGRAPEASVADAEAAAEQAAEAFKSWSRTTPEERADLLDKAGDILEGRMEEFFPLVQAETGATLRVTKTMQVPQAVVRFRRYARGALEPDVVPAPPNISQATALAPGGLISGIAASRPAGVVACITSFNFPLTNMAGKIGPALARGNCVIVKPAPQDPLAVIRLVEVLEEAGFPPGVVSCITSSRPEPAEALVTSPHVDMVSFTGSTGVGARIQEKGAATMTRLLLELGGKGACLVLDDADVDAAVSGAGSTWAFHSGQICTAPTRVIAQRGVYDQVVEKLTQFAGFLKVGDPLDRDTVVGPVITAAHRGRVEGYIAAGQEDGGILAVGGKRPEMEKGFYVAPTLIADAKPTDRLAQEEVFGPVIVAIPFDDEEEGIAIVNGTDFGLYDYVFTADSPKAMDIASRIRSGNVGLNTMQRSHETPFGGFKMSGVGRDGGSYGLEAYSEKQSVVWSA